MDYCSDLGSSDWKTEPGGEMSQQSYLAYLKLKKRSEKPSNLNMKSQTEIVTVRRTRRVLYRYILDMEETNENEKEGDIFMADMKSEVVPRIELKRKKLLKNISLEPNVKIENNSDSPRIKKPRKKLPENHKLESTVHGKNEFSNDPKSIHEMKETDDSPSKKQRRKRPMDLMNDCRRIAHKKRKKIVSTYPIGKNIKTVFESNDDPEKIKIDNKQVEREFQIVTERKLPDYYISTLKVQKGDENNGEIKFMLPTEKSLNPQSVVAEKTLDGDAKMLQASSKSKIFNSFEKTSSSKDGVLQVPNIGGSIEPSQRTEITFNNHSTIEEQLQEIFFPGEYMTEIGTFLPVPHIEIEVEIETTSEVIPTSENAVENNFPTSLKDEQMITDTGKTTDNSEEEQKTYDTLDVYKRVLDSDSNNQQITNDTFRVLQNSLEPSNSDEQMAANTTQKDEYLHKIFFVETNVIDNCITNPEVALEIEVDNSPEIISTTEKSLNYHTLESNNDKDKITEHSLDQCQKDTSLECNNDEQKIQRIDLKIIELPVAPDKDEHGIREDPSDSYNGEQQRVRDTSKITEHTLERNDDDDDCQTIREDLKIAADDYEQQITADTSRMTEHPLKQNNDKQQIGRNTLKIVELSIEPDADEQQISREDLKISADDDEQQITIDTSRTTEHSLKENNDKQQIERNTLKIVERSIEPDADEHQITKHSLESFNDEQQRTRDVSKIIKYTPEANNHELVLVLDYTETREDLKISADDDEQQIPIDTSRITEHPLKENNDEQQIERSTLKIVEPDADEHHIIKNSLESFNVEHQRRDGSKITEYTLEPNNHECQITREDNLKISTTDEQQIIIDTLRITEQSLKQKNDERQIERNTLKLTELSLELITDEQQRTRDTSRISEHTLQPNNNDCQIKRDDHPQISGHSLELNKDNQQKTKDASEHSLKQKEEQEKKRDILKTEHSLESNFDLCQMKKETLKSSAHYREAHNDEQEITKDTLRTTKPSVDPYNDGQQRSDTLRMREHSLENKQDEQEIRKDTLKITQHSTDLNNDVGETSKDKLQMTERCLEAYDDERQVTKDTLSTLVHNDDEQQMKIDNLRIEKHFIKNDEQHRTRDTFRTSKNKNNKQKIKKDDVIITDSASETDNDEHQKSKNNLILTDHSAKYQRHAKQQVTKYTVRKRIHSVGSKSRKNQVTRDIWTVTELYPNYDEWQITRDTLEISKHSIETDNNEQEVIRGTLRMTEHSLQLNNEWRITEENPKISKHSLGVDNDGQQMIKHTLKLTVQAVEPYNDELQTTKEVLRILQHSPEIHQEEQIRSYHLRIPEQSIELNYGKQEATGDTLKTTEYSLEPEPNKDEQQRIKDTLQITTDAELELSQEPSNSEEQVAIGTMRKEEDLQEITNYPLHADDDEQQITRDTLRTTEHHLETNNDEQQIKKDTSRIIKHCPEPSSYEDDVTKYAYQLQNISSPERNDGIEDSFFPELHVEVEVEINDGTDIISIIGESLDNHSPKPNSDEGELLNDTTTGMEDFYREPENFSTKSISEIENQRSPYSRTIDMEKTPEKQLSSCSGVIKTKERLQNNYMSGKLCASQNLAEYMRKLGLILQYKEVECGEPSRIEVVHYKPNNIFQRKYCTFCNVGYTNGIILEKHMSRCKLNPKNIKVDPGKIFYCKNCNFGITDKVFFRQHKEKCQNEVISKPVNSSSNSATEGTGSKVKKKRSAIGRYKCPNCQYTSDNIGHMDMHKRIHNKIPLCVCDVCQKGFTRLDSLKLHMFKHIDIAKEIIEVEKIDVWKGNASKSTLEVNIKDKEFTIVKYQCSKCKYATPIADSMDKHFNTIHLNLMNFKCNLCSFTTKVKTNLKQHLNWHSKEKTYKCSYCSYETINKSYIKHHENQVHLKAVSFKCDSCDFVAYRKENLKTHINSIHLKQKKYSCKQCDFFCYVQSNLIGHVKCVHEGIKRKYKQK